ncbi:MAG TPA: asparagine synthase (glutamine-hydrolyzing), partial [Cytophagales bacterium]|nr:asparagine synthase (glutamine-hydrolyzing) [Cytophagales bacterium]
MCGIAGFVTQDAFDKLEHELPETLNALAHRGPDSSGLYFDRVHGVGLAHRRLSIIDLSDAGHQPMSSEDKSLQIVYNGEIYNFMNIRKDLQRKGYQFFSTTDTEVVLNAYCEWGVSCLDRFVGMFAFAIWDRNKKRLFLARDRMGIKPLFYHLKTNALVFASELKAMMALKSFEKEVDEASLPLFLHYQYIPEPRTIFQNTYKLPPGSFLLYGDKHATVKSYWSVPAYKNSNQSEEIDIESSVVEKLDQLLTQAVADCLVSDVPLGALLSGGIDSSIVAALMQKVNSSPVRTFSIGFDDNSYNEAPWAKKIASHLGTNHTELYMDSRQALDVIPHLADIYDEPFADSSAIPTFLVSRLTRQQVKVALSGDGGDEQFGGYSRYWMTLSMAKWMGYIPIGCRKIVAHALKYVRTSWIEKC